MKIHMSAARDYACERCFRDERIVEWIREEGSITNCGWCGATKVKVLPLYTLCEAFREVASIYVESNGPYKSGDSIEFLLQEDWQIFSERITEFLDNRLRELTLAILYAAIDPKEDVDLPDYSGDFRSPSSWLEEDWEYKVEALFNKSNTESLAEECAGSDMFAPPFDVLEVAFEDLSEAYPEGIIFYRARIHEDRLRTEWYGPNELGAPPPEKTPAGRGNREGEPVLYLSSDPTTAVAEIRAWRHTAVAVAQFRLLEPLQIVDLLKYESPVSPFFDEHLEWRLQLRALFHRFADELSRPIMPHEKDILYIPSQHLCELVKANGYEGVVYPSGLGPGFNFILFCATKAVVTNVSYVRVTEIRHETEQIEKGASLYEESPYDHLISQKNN